MSTNQNNETLEAVTGVQLAQGIGHQEAKGFWAEAWEHVARRPAAIFGLVWIAIVAFFAIFAPLIASGHPLIFKTTNADGATVTTSPLINSLASSDVVLIFWGILAPILLLLPSIKLTRSERLRIIMATGIQSAIMVVLAMIIESKFTAFDASDSIRDLGQQTWFPPVTAALIALIAAIPFLLISGFVYRSLNRCLTVAGWGALVAILVVWKWSPVLNTFDYRNLESTTESSATYTLVPFSPNQAPTAMFTKSPGSTPMNAMWSRLELDERLKNNRPTKYSEEDLAEIPVTDEHYNQLISIGGSIDPLTSYPIAETVQSFKDQSPANLLELRDIIVDHPAPVHTLGTDTLGQDVLSQMLHACRLSISIGLVSTSIAVVIGVTLGALMGYFGGWVDLILYRVVELFMAVPVLFLLIVAASVLPRNIYFMMAIIGCFSWTGAARFIRAEFMKLREADYIQAAKVTGLPLWSILFKHMLPNGITPVLVDSSFMIAAAILTEAILSYLGLGPSGQASWGSLLRNATGDAGGFSWWLAIFPGGAIFLTTVAYNLVGEALRDAIDPKLKKARV